MRFNSKTKSGGTPESLFLLAACGLLGFALDTPQTRFGPQSNEPTRYAVIDLGTNFFPVAINSNGTIASGGAVWSQGTQTTLAACPNGGGSATAINNSGVVAGSGRFTYTLTNSVVETHACTWSPPYTGSSSVTDLETQQGDAYHNYWSFVENYSSFATAISDSGNVYGYDQAEDATRDLQFFSNSAPTTIDPSWNPNYAPNTTEPPLSPGAKIRCAAGTNYCGDYNYYSFYLLTNGYIINSQLIPVPSAYSRSSTCYANAINTNGVAVGILGSMPIVIQGGGITNLPGTGTPQAINNYATISTNTPPVTNNAPQIVGVDSTGVNATLWDQTYYDGTPTTNSVYIQKNLTAMIAQPTNISSQAPASWTVTSAVGINDSGAIVGTANYTQIPYAPVQHGVMLCPVAVVQDSQNDHVIDMTDQPLQYVRFGLWDSAFSTINPPSPITGSLATPTVNNGNAEASNFVGNDSRRFYIRIYDPSANHSTTTADTVTVDWFTQTSSGTDDDHPSTDTITLTETGVNTSVFVSKALMLVTDEVDNGQPTNTGLSGGGNANEGHADHRLRRAALGDKMCYSYTPAATGSTKQTFSLPIFNTSSDPTQPDTIKNITVHFVETKTSTHNTINSNDITNMETQMSARWAVAGISPQYIYNSSTDVLDVTSTGIDLNNVDGSGLPGGQCYEIAQLLRTQYGAYNSSDPTIWVVVVGQFNASTGAGGLSFTDGLVDTYLSQGLITSLSQEYPILHCSFLAQIGGLNNPVAAPHELGHQLSDQVAADAGTDSNHYDGLNLGQNMMYWSANDVPQLVTDSKRLWDDPAHADVVHQYQIDYMRQSPLCH